MSAALPLPPPPLTKSAISPEQLLIRHFLISGVTRQRAFCPSQPADIKNQKTQQLLSRVKKQK